MTANAVTPVNSTNTFSRARAFTLGFTICTAVTLGCAPEENGGELAQAPIAVATEALSQNGITYNGGNVVLTPSVYVIWYGDWLIGSKDVITNFLTHVGGSDYWSILSTYTNGSGVRISNSLRYGGSVDDHFSQGTEIGVGALDDDIGDVISAAIDNGLPNDPSGIYLVLTGPDARWNETFGTSFCEACGVHRRTTAHGAPHLFAVVGNPVDQCPSACGVVSPTLHQGPLTDAGADAMITAIAHELAEVITDPNQDAWYGSSSTTDEMGDKCEWTFSEQFVGANGALANLTLPSSSGSLQYHTQQLWVNGGPAGYCAMRPLAAISVGFTGNGGVTANPPDVNGVQNCNNFEPCTLLYRPNTGVTLTATPASGWSPGQWVLCDTTGSSGSNTTCTVNAGVGASARAVGVTFSCTPHLNQACYTSCVRSCEAGGQRPAVCLPQCRSECSGC